MSSGVSQFISHLAANGYNSRSNKHSDALSDAIARDLFTVCPLMRERCERSELVYQLNFKLVAGSADWNVDLAIGTPPPAQGDKNSLPIRRNPARVQIAIELKSIMTEHNKQKKNRKRDMEAHHSHVHDYYAGSIAGGVFVINSSPIFKSSLRNDISTHKDPNKLVSGCIEELSAVSRRTRPSESGLDAACAIVLSMSNVDGDAVQHVKKSPAPSVGHPLHYDSFIQQICDLYAQKFR
ncbi:MAG: hypothetical protein AAF532_04440 [Planctomycetota bacterium]